MAWDLFLIVHLANTKLINLSFTVCLDMKLKLSTSVSGVLLYQCLRAR